MPEPDPLPEKTLIVEHVWTCGRCGQRLAVRVGAILATFAAHVGSCPGLSAPRPPADDRRRAPRRMPATGVAERLTLRRSCESGS